MIKSKQLKVGNKTEEDVAKLFNKYGYWSHIIAKNKSGGQPCDIVAIKNDINWLVDAKHVEFEKVSFTFDRIEANQITSFDYAKNFANIKNIGFVIYFERIQKFMFLHFDTFVSMKKLGAKSVNMYDLPSFEEEYLCK